IGILLVGILLGPQLLNQINPDLLAIGSDLRLIALIVILLRAGFELSRKTLHRVGGQALLLAFIPATCEGVVITLAGHQLLGLTLMEAALLGSIQAAVSPAVGVPRMIAFIKERRGAKKAIPSMVMAAASVDDIYVIVVHSVLIGLAAKERLFVAVAYSPKATVQAAIGASPLLAMRAAGMATGPGEIILAVAVLSILLTAPTGAWAINALGRRVLPVEPEAGETGPHLLRPSPAGISLDPPSCPVETGTITHQSFRYGFLLVFKSGFQR
ncbi:MAG: cation:proton antiporter, partial [Candidatus Erginobacter occultus]|nr:cation:proton antiporter [Candidatus Erginobacter occultus]